MKTKVVKPVEQNAIVTQLSFYAEMCDGKQKAFYEQQLKDIHRVSVQSIFDVFSEKEIETIKMVVRPKQKECYKNAHLLTALFPDKVQYVEGYTTIFNGGFPIEHAWNKVGDVYVDITFEMALNTDPTKELYMALGAYNLTTITNETSISGYYGSIYNQRFVNKQNMIYKVHGT